VYFGQGKAVRRMSADNHRGQDAEKSSTKWPVT
jgi:hypothetical protein